MNAGQAMSWKRRATARAVSMPPNWRTTGTKAASATCPPTHTVAPRTCKNSRMAAAWTGNTNGGYDARPSRPGDANSPAPKTRSTIPAVQRPISLCVGRESRRLRTTVRCEATARDAIRYAANRSARTTRRSRGDRERDQRIVRGGRSALVASADRDESHYREVHVAMTRLRRLDARRRGSVDRCTKSTYPPAAFGQIGNVAPDPGDRALLLQHVLEARAMRQPS
jgi:hypothetical protein